MRVIFAIDEQAQESYRGNLPNCLRWAEMQAEASGNPVKILVARPGSKEARIIAEATRDGLRAVHAGRKWPRKKLERMYGKCKETV